MIQFDEGANETIDPSGIAGMESHCTLNSPADLIKRQTLNNEVSGRLEKMLVA